MMVVVVMMTPNELISLHLLKMMLNFPSCLSTINGESIRTGSMVFAWKLSQESTQSPGGRSKTDMQAQHDAAPGPKGNEVDAPALVKPCFSSKFTRRVIKIQNGPSCRSDFCSKNDQTYWYLQC